MSNFLKKVFFSLISLSFLLNQHAIAGQIDNRYEYFSAPFDATYDVILVKKPAQSPSVSAPENLETLAIKKNPTQHKGLKIAAGITGGMLLIGVGMAVGAAIVMCLLVEAIQKGWH